MCAKYWLSARESAVNREVRRSLRQRGRGGQDQGQEQEQEQEQGSGKRSQGNYSTSSEWNKEATQPGLELAASSPFSRPPPQ